MIVSERNPYRDWIAGDLAAELLDGEPGEQVTADGWADLHGTQAAATPKHPPSRPPPPPTPGSRGGLSACQVTAAG
jgi:hypothetical protein